MTRENVQNICRICLDVESQHVSIIEDSTIHLHIKSCLAMTVSATDDLPKDICVSCASQLSDFYSLKLNAMFSLEWLESCVQEKSKKPDSKSQTVQPLPDSEYNSDSLLEFLNNTANIDEYLNNLGKEDIPSIVNMLDRNNENSMEAVNKAAKSLKTLTPNKEVSAKGNSFNFNMEVDMLDSDIEIVNEILRKEAEAEPKNLNKFHFQTNSKSIENFPTPSKTNSATDSAAVPTTSVTINTKTHPMKTPPKTQIKPSNGQIVNTEPKLTSLKSSNVSKCFACKLECNNMQNLSQHVSTCELAQRTCIQCHKLYDSRLKMVNHALTHNTGNGTRCKCNKQFISKEKLLGHQKTCQFDYSTMLNCVYRCKKCKETFKDRFKLYKHVKKHLLGADTKYCNICGKNFIGNAELIKHRKEFHGETCESGLLYRCKVCSHTSSSHQELYIHVQTHLLREVEPESNLCDICGQYFKSRPLLMRHTLTHKNVVKKEIGELCNSNTNAIIKNQIRHENTILVEKVKGTVKRNEAVTSCHYNGQIDVNEAKVNVKRDIFDVKSYFKNRNATLKIPDPKIGNPETPENCEDNNDVKCANLYNVPKYPETLTKSIISNEMIKSGKDLPEIKSIVEMCEKCGQNVDRSQLDHHICV